MYNDVTFARVLLGEVLGHVLHGAEDVGLAPGDAGHLLAVEVRQRVAERHLVTNMNLMRSGGICSAFLLLFFFTAKVNCKWIVPKQLCKL